MRITQRDAAAIIAGLERIDEERQRILDILLPDADPDQPEPGCTHPDDALDDLSTLDEDRYHCRACDAELTSHPRSTNPQE